MRAALVAVGIVLLVAGAVLDRTGWWGWAGAVTDSTVLVVALVVLATGGLIARSRAVAARWIGAVTTAASGVVAAVVLADAVRDGLPGPAVGVLLVGVAAVVGGAVARVARVSARRHLVGSAGVVVVAVAAAIGAALVVDTPQRTTTDAPPVDAAVVTRGDTVRWAWTAGGPVADVVPIRGGVAVLRGADGPRGDAPEDADAAIEGPGDEVVALDGTTGTPRWTFRHGQRRVDALTPSPDGTVLAVSYVLPGRGAVVTVLDAASGATRFTVVTPVRRGVLQLTERVLTVLDPLPAPVPTSTYSARPETTYRAVAHRLDDGGEAWSFDPPSGCTLGVPWSPTLGPPGRWTLVTRDVGVAPLDCGRDRVLTGLDDRTGTVRWSTPGVAMVTPDGEVVGAEPTVTGLPDGTAVLLGGAPAQVVDAATGAARPVPGLGEFDLGAVRPGPVRALALTEGLPTGSIDPRTGAIVPLPAEAPGECATPEGAVTVTDTGTLRLCGTGVALRVDDGPTLPVDLGPPAPVDPDTRRDTLLYRRSPDVLLPAPGALVLTTTRTDPAVVVGVA